LNPVVDIASTAPMRIEVLCSAKKPAIAPSPSVGGGGGTTCMSEYAAIPKMEIKARAQYTRTIWLREDKFASFVDPPADHRAKLERHCSVSTTTDYTVPPV
jgi:hypothetical protein